jgi:N utilization substance protein B
MQHWRESLDSSAKELEQAQQNLVDSELQEGVNQQLETVRGHLRESLSSAEQVLNGLSASLELPRLLLLGDQEQIRQAAMQRVTLVVEQRDSIDSRLDAVMEGWRLSRLPRIDRDILRLAVVDLIDLSTPAPVAFNEAVELANRYSDEQGRRMINGVLRRFHDAITTASA